MTEAKEIVFGSDTIERKKWFVGISFSHPAKMSLPLQIYLIEHYTKPGDIILDPMFGSGSLLVGCAIGRNVIGVELEQKFVDMAKANWEKIRRLGPILGYTMGTATILQGDSRQLPDVLADHCIMSPPYENSLQDGHTKGRTNGTAMGYNDTAQYADKVIFSPPYEDANIGDKRKKHNLTIQGLTKDGKPRGGSLKAKFADAVICSPPYEGSLTGKPGIDWTKCDNGKRDRTKEAGFKNVVERHSGYTDIDPSIKRLREHKRTDPKAGGNYGRSLAHPYSGAAENIGNLKGESYLSAMLLTYQSCHQVLKDEGLMVLVTKNFIRAKKIIDLAADTIKLCEQAGFKLIERLARRLTQQSFWRTIYYKKYPDAPRIDVEDVLVLEKIKLMDKGE